MEDIALKENIRIEDRIYEIRGKQVMLDSDLAKLYHVETKRINEAVKNNTKKFPKRFSWVLTGEEWNFLRSKFSTLEKNISGKGRYRKYLPRVFTEQGVAMLSTVLKSKVAVEVSINIMDAFVAMRHYIGNTEYRLSNIETKVLKHDNEIELLQKTFEKLEEKKKINEIYFNGQIYDAYSKILEIFKSAKKKIIIIDSYADNTILDIIRRLNVKVTIITKGSNLLIKQDIDKYNKQYSNLKAIYDNTFHDRYFIIDEISVYHCGASINRIGYKTFSVTLLSDKEVCKLLTDRVNSLVKRM